MLLVAVLFPFQHEDSFWLTSWACVRAGMIAGLFAIVPVWLVLRRGATLSPAMTGGGSGLFAGLTGTTTLAIHCPNLNAWHILVAHLGVAFLGAMIGFLIGAAAGRKRGFA